MRKIIFHAGLFIAAAVLTGCSSAVNAKAGRTFTTTEKPDATVNSGVAKTNAAAAVPDAKLPVEFSAALADPVDVDLKWKANIPDVAGYFVDFNMGSDRMFRVLDIVSSNVTAYRHPHLMPHTRFAYRVRPFFGKASSVAEFVSRDAPDEASGNGEITTSRAPVGAEGTYSLRNRLTSDHAVPTGLAATRVGPRIADLSWKDNAKDEDGYLLEVSMGSDRDFHVIALLETNTVSFRVCLLPPDTKCYFRVRAFCEGWPSLADEKTTGAAPVSAASASSEPK